MSYSLILSSISVHPDCKEQEPGPTDDNCYLTADGNPQLLAPNTTYKAPGLAAIKERSFESQISTGSSATSLPQDSSSLDADKPAYFSSDDVENFPKLKSVLPLIEAEDMPYHYYNQGDLNKESGDFSSARSLRKHRPHDVPGLSGVTDEMIENKRNSGAMRPQIEHRQQIKTFADSNFQDLVSACGDSSPQHTGKKTFPNEKNYQKEPELFTKINTPSTLQQATEAQAKASTSGKCAHSGRMANTKFITSPLFNIDDAIEGTSDAIRELLHTSDEIDVIMKHTNDDIGKALE